MKRTIIVFAVLVTLAFLVAPALAAPSPQHKVTWRGSGVTGNSPTLSDEIMGAQVRFDGTVNEGPPDMWSGQGTFVDRRNNLKVNLVRIDTFGVSFLSENRVHITGDADVVINGVIWTEQPFELDLDKSSSEFQLVIERGIDPTPWKWWIPGSTFKGSIRIT